MIDIHCHILPSIDDGPNDLESSIEMFRIAEGDGITHIVATPHFKVSESPTIVDIQQLVLFVRERIARSGIGITLMGGADIHLSYELLNGLDRATIPTINGSRYFLLELPDLFPPNLDHLIHAARLKGLVPVITHPERNYGILISPSKASALRSSGALLQLTAMSITGGFGRQVRRLSQWLLKNGLVDVVASDAHGVKKRSPVLSDAYREVSKLRGEREARRLFFDNPTALIDDREILFGR